MRLQPPLTHRQLKLTLCGLTLLTHLMVIAALVYVLASSRERAEQRASQLAQNLGLAVARDVSATVEKIDLALLGVVDELEAQLATGGVDVPRSERTLRKIVSHHPELEDIRVTDAAGLVFIGPEADRPHPQDLSGREWFQRQRAQRDIGLLVTKPIRGLKTQRWLISFSRRYVRPDGSFAGAVTASVPLTLLARLLAGLDVGEHGSVGLRDTDLGLVARWPALPDQATGEVGHSAVSGELAAAARSGVAQAVFRTPRTADGVERIVSLRRLQAAPFFVLVGLGVTDYLQEWRREAWSAAAFCLCFIAVSSVSTMFLFGAFVGRNRAQRRLHMFGEVFQHSGEAIALTDRNCHVLEINSRFTRITGRTMADLQGRLPRFVSRRAFSGRKLHEVLVAVRDTGGWQGEMWVRHQDGRDLPIWLNVATVTDAKGRATHRIVSFSDTSVLKEAEQRILRMVHQDALTGLANRGGLQGRLLQAISGARRNGLQLAVMFVDLDRFKNVNDTLGHAVGDGLLVQVAERLRGIVRDSDVVARLGGDEFVVVLTDLGDAAQQAAAVASKLVNEFARPFVVKGHELHTTPSIGIGIFPADGDDGDTLMKHADAAMYHAKDEGRNNYQFFTARMNAETSERLALEGGLRRALERGEFLLHYQPQIELASGAVVGVEALVRWQSPNGLVPPEKFIRVAEETGLILPLGDWVLGEAIRQLGQWQRDGLVPRWGFAVAVNLSASQLRVPDFLQRVSRHLQDSLVPAGALELEITESVAMQRPEHTIRLLHGLRRMGVELAIDDFGTGYSSLAYLKQMPLNRLKLDRSFVRDIETDANDAAISTATIQLAHNLSLEVVAEGVETAAQLEFLRSLGCDRVQGYFFAKPLPADDCARFIRERAAATT